MVEIARRAVGLALPLAAILTWQLLVDAQLLTLEFLPAPDGIMWALFDLVRSGDLVADLLHTGTVTVLASIGALAMGGVLGLAIGLLPRLRTNVLGSIDVLRTIPAVALMPIALLALGPVPSTELLLAVWAAQWPVLINTAGAVRGVPDRLYDVSRMARMSKAATLRTVVIPAVVPSWLAGARVATIVALHVAITAEMVMAPSGLGGSLVQAMQALNTERMWAYTVVCGLVGALAASGLRRLVAVGLPGSPVHRQWSAR